MENRSIFALDGITGMLIATVLLLSILVGLTVWGLGVQQGSANNFYQIQNEKEIQMISTENATHKIDVK
ncbi:MAG: DUF4006 family protein [Sulfuricurvum sp.]|uniref:DUF4006 family protein n=1 Tax=Sulfuricurvum sp. TaxID=2025608 RepID=UPI00260E1215|nr:DUF4006 family protein [Sulfuricurvum sp.]MDD2949846.1 DUF4006 family protein [Sulfuricurvum sp.]MDD5117256.1 DUF4006 family protein [Sulfuricurvum sp.]